MTKPDATWSGVPPCDGWFWLERRKGGELRLGFYTRVSGSWRVTDAIGRTVLISQIKIVDLFHYRAPVEPPRARRERELNEESS